MENLIPVIRVLGFRIVIASINSVQHSYVSKHMMFRKYFISTLFGTLLSGLIGVVLALNGFGVWALVAQYMTNTVVDTIVLWFTVKWRPILFFSFDRVKQLFSFGWKVLFEAVSQTFSEQFRSLLIGKVYTSSDLAFYNKAQQFPNLLITNIGTSISSVLFPAMSRNQEDKDEVLKLLRRSTKISSFVIFPLMMGLAMAAEPLIRLILTEKWIECVPYLRIFCFTQAATVGMTTRHQALLSTGRSDVYMLEHVIYRILFLTIVVIVFRNSVMAIALTNVVGTVFMVFTVMVTSKKYSKYGYIDQIMDVLPIIFFCVVMAIPLYFINKLELNDFMSLIIQFITGTIIYILLSYLTKHEGFIYCKMTILKLFKR